MPKHVRATLAEVIAKFPEEVRHRYDFSAATYHGALVPIEGIVCAQHGAFKQYAAQLRKGGAGCPSCGNAVRAGKRRNDTDLVVERARAAHGERYDYSKVAYRSQLHKVVVGCPDHGDFEILPINHWRGQGCPVCGAAKRGRRKDLDASARRTADTKIAQARESFEADARAIHGDAYDYSLVDYQTRKLPVTIICRKHGAFTQTPDKHLQRAQGCPECSHHRSKGESAIQSFLSIFAEVRSRDRSVVPPKELDIYLPDRAVAVEYCGEYWHGARKVEDEAFARRRHADKLRACEARGIRLFTVYESEWLERPATIKRILRNAIGATRGRLMARKCEAERIPAAEASAFFERYHPQGGGGWGEHYGLRYSGKLVACMRFTFGSNDRGANHERMWTLSRYATRLPVAGGASRLFKAFVSERNPSVVKSFSDNRYFTGGMYERLGFVLEEEMGPDYQVYHQKLGLLPKTAWQRRKLPTRIREVGSKEVFHPATDLRTEREMTFLLGAQRLYDCGKKRWVWTHSP